MYLFGERWEFVGKINSFKTLLSSFSIVQWAYPETLNTSQALDTLQKRIELLGATNLGNWSVDCEVLQATSPIISKEYLPLIGKRPQFVLLYSVLIKILYLCVTHNSTLFLSYSCWKFSK